MKRVAAILLCMVIWLSSYGQKPVTSGYLNKTNYLNLRLATGLTYQHPGKPLSADEWRAAGGPTGGNSLKRELELIAGKVISNHLAVEVNYGYHTTGLDMASLRPGAITRTAQGTMYGDVYGFPKVTDSYLGLKFKLYSRKRGALAPLGFYHGFQLNMHRYKTDLSDVVIPIQVLPGVFGEYHFEQRIWYNRGVDANWSMGVNRAIGESVLLELGVSTGFSFGVSRSRNWESMELDRRVSYHLGQMLLRYNLNKVYFCVGYLI
ncbi:MAG: hypothetical protein JJ975_00145 [Bacteroidia bacterium]|nr:hypothetical protein [Bacteroidia bacterium]